MIPKFSLINSSTLLENLNRLIDYQKPLNLNDGSVNGSVIRWNITERYNSYVTLSTNSSLEIVNLSEGDYGTIKIRQDATGGRTLILPAGSKVSGGGAGVVTLTPTGNSIDILTFYCEGGVLYFNVAKDFT